MVFELTVNQKTFLINEDDVLYVQLGDGSVSQNEALTVDIVMIDDKHITITSGKNSEVKEIYEKIKKRLIADMIKFDLVDFSPSVKTESPR